MRRIISSILSLTVFLFLQYGNIASYYYCKWQAEQRQSLVDCGCEIHLESVFGGVQHHDGITTPDIKLPVFDLAISKSIVTPLISIHTISSTDINYSTSLLEGFSLLPFHPPIV
jgi:hypothetical protein